MDSSQPLLVVVTDATIWIDLHNSNLYVQTLRLQWNWLTTDLVENELLSPDVTYLRENGLQVRSLPGLLVSELVVLRARYNRPSLPDLSALVLAKDLGAVLLTGDASLRNAAQAESVRVHGVLWLLDEMVNAAVVTTAEASTGLEAMVATGSRLPQNEVAKRLRQWKI